MQRYKVFSRTSASEYAKITKWHQKRSRIKNSVNREYWKDISEYKIKKSPALLRTSFG